jgi:hypothetical protein
MSLQVSLYRVVILVIAVGVENHTHFGCATEKLVSQIGGGIDGIFHRRKSVNCHVGMYM